MSNDEDIHWQFYEAIRCLWPHLYLFVKILLVDLSSRSGPGSADGAGRAGRWRTRGLRRGVTRGLTNRAYTVVNRAESGESDNMKHT